MPIDYEGKTTIELEQLADKLFKLPPELQKTLSELTRKTLCAVHTTESFHLALYRIYRDFAFRPQLTEENIDMKELRAFLGILYMVEESVFIRAEMKRGV